MLPGKQFTPAELLSVLRRRIWLLLVPFALVSAATAIWAQSLPERYRSETVILVVPQRVPESYVKSTVTARIEDRLQSITQQILSRTRLERIIQDFDLYAADRRTTVMEDVVDRMRSDIAVRVVKGDAFSLSYVGDNARTVMQVVERLASLFIEENLRDREVLAEGTNQFLEAQLEDARVQLIEREKKLEAYRTQHGGELPSQLPSNLQVIQNTQMQVQTIIESMNRDRDRRLLVERQLEEAEQMSAADSMAAETIAAVRNRGNDGAVGETAAQRLAVARDSLVLMQRRLKADHPDVQRMNRVISDLEQKAAAEAMLARDSATVPQPVSPAVEARRKRVVSLRAELAQIDNQIAFKQREEIRLREVAAVHQRRVERAPTRESELAELTRDYSTLQTLYTTLLTKKEESKIAANLERQQIGEQFRLLDPARMAERPFSPDRRLISLGGMGAGLALGVLLIALSVYRDRTFRTDSELVTVLSLPVLAVVPSMKSPGERRGIMFRRVVVGLGLGSVVAVCFAVVGYALLR